MRMHKESYFRKFICPKSNSQAKSSPGFSVFGHAVGNGLFVRLCDRGCAATRALFAQSYSSSNSRGNGATAAYTRTHTGSYS